MPQLLPIAAALMVFLAGGMIVFGIRSIRARASTPEMEDRLQHFGTMIEFQAPTVEGSATSAVTDRIERAVHGTTWAERAMTAIARANLRMTIGEFYAIRGGSAIVGFLLGLLVGRAQIGVALLFGILGLILGWMVPAKYLTIRANRRQKKFVAQLGDAITVMANSLRAGYSLLQTMELVSRESPEPMAEEFRRVVREVGLGISPQQALEHLLRRVPSEDLDLLVSAINIQHEIGGNLGQILDVIGETIRERVRIQGEIKVLTSQQQLSGNVIVAMPVLLTLAMFLINPEYMSTILVWPWLCLPIGGSMLLLIGFLAMRKIVAIEV